MDCRYERRRGKRVVLDALPVVWRVPPSDGRRHLRRTRKPCVQSGALLDLSAHGLRVRAPRADDLAVSSLVEVEVQGVVGTVIVRWVEAVPGTGFSDYGLEIAPSATALASWCAAMVSLNADVDELRWVVGPWRAAHAH